MEPVTHTLTGYLMSRAGLNRWCPLATPVLLMAVNVPDIDFVALLTRNDLLVLDWHRGATHALAFVALMAVLPLLPMLVFARGRMRWRRAYAVSVLGVLSHLFLDWTNIYGVRLLEPFSSRYFHLDTTGVTDLWMLAVLAAAAAWYGISRLVGAEIGSRKGAGAAVAIAALLFVGVWQTGRFFLHRRAVAILDARLYGGEPPTRVAALPHFGSPFRWTGLVETAAAYRVYEISVLDAAFDPMGGKTFYKPGPSPAIDAARTTYTFQHFLRFAQYGLWRVTPAAEPEGAERVELMDMRFGYPGEERFVATAIVDRAGRVLRSWFQFDPPGGGPRFR